MKYHVLACLLFFSVRVKDENHYDFFELKLGMRLRAQTLQLADSEREG